MRITLEHLSISAISADRIELLIERVDLPPGVDPVTTGFSHHENALSHSTSWRAEPGSVILTFAHVLPDRTELTVPAADRAKDGDLSRWSGGPEELESLPSACHAVRHLHFLRFTDQNIESYEGLDEFWAYAHSVADHHYPAVAGLLFTHGLAQGPDYVI